MGQETYRGGPFRVPNAINHAIGTGNILPVYQFKPSGSGRGKNAVAGHLTMLVLPYSSGNHLKYSYDCKHLTKCVQSHQASMPPPDCLKSLGESWKVCTPIQGRLRILNPHWGTFTFKTVSPRSHIGLKNSKAIGQDFTAKYNECFYPTMGWKRFVIATTFLSLHLRFTSASFDVRFRHLIQIQGRSIGCANVDWAPEVKSWFGSGCVKPLIAPESKLRNLLLYLVFQSAL